MSLSDENNTDESQSYRVKNKRTLNKNKRMHGKEYEGISEGKTSQKEPRKMKAGCISKYCEKSRKCSKFCESARKEIFDSFWQMSWDQKKMYVTSLIEFKIRKRIYVENSRRSISKSYHLIKNSTRLQVCRTMFLGTLGLTESMVRGWLQETGQHGTQACPEKQVKLRNQSRRNTSQQQKYRTTMEFLEKWLDEVPKLESHYRRQYTSKLYFQSDFKSFNHMYQIYIKHCESQNGHPSVSFPTFLGILKKHNYAIYKPRNDMCDICVSYETKNISQNIYNAHRKEIEDMRDEKICDTENAKSGLCLLICVDMQAVKLIPQLKANASYYKMKLQIHNFTIYNIITHESDNYVWDETEGNLVASTFATCIIKYLRNAINMSPKTHHIIIYSDGCYYQNRNAVLSNALLSLCIEKDITIEHKYLVVGHTQMECDSTHSLIQRRINNRAIYLPSQLVDIMEEARKNPFPLNVHHLDHKYFLNYENLPKCFPSIRPGKRKLI